MMSRKWMQGLPGLLLGIASYHSAIAQTEISPNMFSGMSYMSNVFKLNGDAESATLLNGQDRNDMVKEYGASLDAEIDYKQQTANFHLLWKSNRYDQFRFLDNDAKAFSTRWWGRLGGPLMAGFNYKRSIELTDYSEIERAIDFKNEKQQENLAGQLRLELSGKWRLEAEGAFFRTRFSHESYRESNHDKFSAQSGISFQRSPMKTIRLLVRAGYYDYVERELNENSIVDKQHYIYDVYTALDWSMAGASAIDIEFGVRQRRHVHLSERDVVGPLANVRLRWAPTAKYLFSLSYRYEKAAVERVLANYATINEVSVSSQLQPLHHITANVSGARKWYDYRDGSDAIQRSDFQITGLFE
ncbi:MAG: hypothetical protein OEX19_09905, partial [Gammaproteobacteria bacterium]|nr:hypothetical protein [Gammaproteobacteria bacterium]